MVGGANCSYANTCSWICSPPSPSSHKCVKACCCFAAERERCSLLYYDFIGIRTESTLKTGFQGCTLVKPTSGLLHTEQERCKPMFTMSVSHIYSVIFEWDLHTWKHSLNMSTRDQSMGKATKCVCTACFETQKYLTEWFMLDNGSKYYWWLSKLHFTELIVLPLQLGERKNKLPFGVLETLVCCMFIIGL